VATVLGLRVYLSTGNQFRGFVSFVCISTQEAGDGDFADTDSQPRRILGGDIPTHISHCLSVRADRPSVWADPSGRAV
jgi:hypothetical protein